MRNSLLATASVAGLAMFASGAQAATYIPVTLPAGASSGTVFGINDTNVIAGSFRDSAGVEHGFFGPLNGKYKTFDFGGSSTGTEPRAIGNDGSINGFATGSGFAIGEEFYRAPGGAIKVYQLNGQPLDGVAQNFNDSDLSMGDYFNSVGTRVGYYGKKGKYVKDFKLHVRKYQQNSPRAVTNEGLVAGYFIDKNAAQHGFIQQGKTLQVIDYPDAGAILTVLEDINENGIASGQWDDSSGNPHSFTLNTATGNFKTIDPGDGSTFQQAWNLNKKGLLALSTSIGATYIYCPLKASKCPAAGIAAKEHTVHVPGGTFLKYDAYGRTARKLPPANSVKKNGAIQ